MIRGRAPTCLLALACLLLASPLYAAGGPGDPCRSLTTVIDSIGPEGANRRLYTGLAEIPTLQLAVPELTGSALFRAVNRSPELALLGISESARARIAHFVRNVREGTKLTTNHRENDPALLFSMGDRPGGKWISKVLINPKNITVTVGMFEEALAWSPKVNERFIRFITDNKVPVLDVVQSYRLNHPNAPLAEFERDIIQSREYGLHYYYREVEALDAAGFQRVVLTIPVTREGTTTQVKTVWWIKKES